MLLKLTLLIFFAAIIVFFAQEITQTVKKLFVIPGMKLIAPIALASILVYVLNTWVLWVLYFYRECLQGTIDFLVWIMPASSFSLPLSSIIVLTFVSIAPVYAWDVITRKRAFKWYQFSYLPSSILWVISTVLLFTS